MKAIVAIKTLMERADAVSPYGGRRCSLGEMKEFITATSLGL